MAFVLDWPRPTHGGRYVSSTHSPVSPRSILHLLLARRDRTLYQRPRSSAHYLLPWPIGQLATARVAAHCRAIARSRLVAPTHGGGRLHAATAFRTGQPGHR